MPLNISNATSAEKSGFWVSQPITEDTSHISGLAKNAGTENDCVLEEIPQLYFEAFLQSDPNGFDEYFLKFSEKLKEKMISLPPNPHAKAFSSYCQKRHLEQNLKTPATSAPTRKI